MKLSKKKEVETWVNCPECNIKLKKKHLSTHIKRVHNKKIDNTNKKPLEDSHKKIQENKTPWVISKKIIGLIIIVVVILAFSIFVYYTNNDNSSNGQNNSTKNYFVSIEGKANYSSLHEAIDSASDNDIIFVGSGTYFENIKISKSIELIGEDKNTTIIDGNGSGVVINISADNVKISGFTIRNGGPMSADESNAGILIRSNYNTISDCNISSNKNYGIYLFSISETRNNIIKNNIFSNNKYGVFTYYAIASNISSNTFTYNTDYGIYFGSRSNDNLISDNTFIENNYALRVKTSERNKIINNLIMNNDYGLFFCCGADNNVVYNNDFINNTNWNADDALSNAYDNGVVGNYWDDYNGTDANGDGIGDTPYLENIKNGDNFPLMKPI